MYFKLSKFLFCKIISNNAFIVCAESDKYGDHLTVPGVFLVADRTNVY